MKSKFQFAAFIVMTTFIFAACTTASKDEAKPLDLEKIKPEIQAMEDAFAAAEKAKDADKVVAYYSDDAISYGRNEQPTRGKTAIRDSVAKRLSKDTSGNTWVYKIVDLFGEGNMLVEIGSWTMLNPAGAEVENGHYMSYFQKRDGKYLCVRDMNATTAAAKK